MRKLKQALDKDKSLNDVYDELFPVSKPYKSIPQPFVVANPFEEIFRQYAESFGKDPSPTCGCTCSCEDDEPAITVDQLLKDIQEEEDDEREQEYLRNLDVLEKEIQSPIKISKEKKTTLVVNLFAGPGAGKSTAAAGIFHDLKIYGISCELAAEYAKDLVWEERQKTFEDQIYLFAKQYHRIFRLLGQVDVVITDCPLLLSVIYDNERRETLKNLVYDEHHKMWTYNAFIKRVKKFNPKGRNHNLEQSKQLDRDILNVLDDAGECYETFEGNEAGKDAIVLKILKLLGHEK